MKKLIVFSLAFLTMANSFANSGQTDASTQTGLREMEFVVHRVEEGKNTSDAGEIHYKNLYDAKDELIGTVKTLGDQSQLVVVANAKKGLLQDQIFDMTAYNKRLYNAPTLQKNISDYNGASGNYSLSRCPVQVKIHATGAEVTSANASHICSPEVATYDTAVFALKVVFLAGLFTVCEGLGIITQDIGYCSKKLK